MAIAKICKFFIPAQIVFVCSSVLAQVSTDQQRTPATFYVIVGTFAVNNNAVRFAGAVQSKGYNPKTTFNADKTYQHVYINTHLSKDAAVSQASQVREIFPDVWVKCVGCSSVLKQNLPDTEQDLTIKDEVFSPKILIEVLDTVNSQYVQGEIEVRDVKSATLVKKVMSSTREELPLAKPTNVTLVCSILGYTKAERSIAIMGNGGESLTMTVINVAPLKKGDVITLNQIFFHKDATAMLPESTNQLTELVSFLKMNSAVRVQLHGHTNGNHKGWILAPSNDDDLFSVDQALVTRGSAKLLSQKRAEAVKKYLIKNQIDANRIQVKAWGGDRPLFPEDSDNARQNLRVEVEIL